jgi:predicted nuclease with TOPRIM domain
MVCGAGGGGDQEVYEIKEIMDINNLLAEIKKLPENEFLPFMQEIAEHISKNNWEHLIDKCFDIEDGEDEIRILKREISELEDEVSDLEEDKDDLRREKKELEGVIEEIKKLVN